MVPNFSNISRRYDGFGEGQPSSYDGSDRAKDIYIPLEVDSEDKITGVFVLGDLEIPEGGQTSLFEYAGSQLDEDFSRLTIHRHLDNSTLQKGYTLTLLKLARSIDLSDIHTRGHGPRTSILARFLGRELGLDKFVVDQVALAGLLHDVGKVVVPKSILTKAGQLTEQEWRVIRRHPTFAALIMEPCADLRPLVPMVQAHHERFDGSGYPAGVAGELIPLGGRILALADAFTTMIEGRPYKQAFSIPQTLEEITHCNHYQFDPKVVHALMNLIARGDMDEVLLWSNWRNRKSFDYLL